MHKLIMSSVTFDLKILILILLVWNIGFGDGYLLFPRQAPTRHQFIGGIGIPADLSYESVTIGHVLKAEFWLPYNVSTFRENPFFPDYNNTLIDARRLIQQRSALRWELYNYIENRLYNYGYEGHSCMLRAICEANEHKFARHNNIFEELLHIFFSPSTSNDLITVESHKYQDAELMAHSGQSCDIYHCQFSLVNWISKVLKIDS